MNLEPIQQFIRLVDAYVKKGMRYERADKAIIIRASSGRDTPRVKAAIPGYFAEFQDSRKAVLVASMPLIEALEQVGFNSRDLFMLHNAVEGRRGVANISGLWPPLKAILQQLMFRGGLPAESAVPKADDSSSWVPAKNLWQDRFSTIKELSKFRKKHPKMFRNPSRYKLEIHAGQWARY